MDRAHDDPIHAQWVEMGMHHHHGQYHAPISPPHPQDFGSYGFVESPGFAPPDPQFRLQPPPVPIAPNYLALPQWGQSMAPPAPPVTVSHQHYSSPPALAPAPAPASASQAHPAAAVPPNPPPPTTSTPRRTLTDEDRRKMCIYHEKNPNVKQTEIGAMFGVERSTVSKVLRQKEKYLFPDDGNRSPVKRSKGKFPDIERALSVWARNTRKQGVALTDVMIREKARFFALSVGVSDTQFKANSAGWLEKFKQKNSLHAAGRGRSASDATGLARGPASPAAPAPGSAGHARTGSSTSSAPDGDGEPAGMQHSKSQDSHYGGGGGGSPAPYMDLAGSAAYKSYSQHASGPVSPATPYFSENGMDSAQPSPAFPSQHARLPNCQSIQQRPRSQTFPLIEYISPPASSEPLTPKMLNHALVSPPALTSPVPDMPNPLASPHDTPSSSHTMLGTPEDSQGAPPSRDDARKALETFVSFLQRQPVGFVDPDEYMLVRQLMGKFELDGGPLEAADTTMSYNDSVRP